MAHGIANEPVLTEMLDLKSQTDRIIIPKRSRFRQCKSAPIAELAPLESNREAYLPLPLPISIFHKVHPSLRKVGMYLSLYLAASTISFYLVREQIKGKKINGVLDSAYFCVVTMTTVGYGDLVPNGSASKLLACAFVFSGMAIIGLGLSKAADYLVEKQETLLVRALHMRENNIDHETNRVRYKFLMVVGFLLVLIIVGTIFLVKVENLPLIDAFYCVCSTLTTLGYGDKSFSTKAGRVFAIFWIIMGTLCVAQFFLCCAELHTERRQKELVNRVLTRRMTKLDLEAADLDDDGVVVAAEFVLHKLKEMGKINQEDISHIMDEFEKLDVDQWHLTLRSPN